MIQFNLLPDVKLEYIRARRLKRTVVLMSTLVAAASLTLLVVLFLAVGIFQKKHLNDLSSDIKKESSQLQSIQDLNKILTIQNQLNSLPQLEAQAPVTSRLFSYIQQTTPNNVTISSLTIDMTQKTLNIQGGADNLSTVNTFVDTLKFTKYSLAGSTDQKPAFSNVVLTAFSRNDKDAGYTIDLSFDNTLFDANSDVTLNVPKGFITTRSETEKPSVLFQTQGSTR